MPDYLGFFEFVHNVKYRDKRFLVSLLTLALSHRTTKSLKLFSDGP
uniref:Uncharacterized protein n=2 Tax=Candidatus Kentrum eta TaxID=2126337 RepID=A0A450VJR6_9GAMM|nr:MAG: hypothetical protein BECKH772C_GA0070978_102331 [Candidatus Kentron sp. H]